MRGRWYAVLTVVMLCAGCGGDDGTCGVIADDAIDLMQGLIDQVDEISIEELGELDDTFLADFDSGVAALADRAESARCSSEEMTELFRARVGSLTADSEFGQLFVDQLGSENFFG